ncbi:carbon starvation protein A [Anaerovorax odorimutans]|uniref:Carbon starvation protein A n=1 Tax=Anaerovorax odorimutans TaxID=109327 RepID=A0ABT1RJX5_9FIRM|nr:carbon starvation protein A [Anaerovorax odorimutans]MCQ4635478.1 carbon starvation protein A [Anaerovorax odorimutans]
MNAALLLIIGIVLFLVAYATYGRFLAKKWGIDARRSTPAHTLRDDVDYCPADAKVILGHHFSSIAGAGPITGPIQAIIFGWLPVYLWVVIGSIFFGGVHDFGSIFASLRHDGKSIGEVVRQNIGQTGKLLFNLFSWLALVLVVAAFADICAGTFAYDPANPDNLTGAMAGTASVLFIALAVLFGIFVYRKNANIAVSTVIGVAALFVCIWVGYTFPVLTLSKTAWIVIVLVYIVIASVMPVWILLQPRDYLCSFLLYALLIGAVAGIFIKHPNLELDAFTSFAVSDGTSIQYLFPILFITVACGAISGFHSLVGSGTTSKQINKESDAKLIGYGAMLIEGVVAIVTIIAVAYTAVQVDGTPAVRFAAGVATFMSGFGLPMKVGTVFIILSFSAFALTSLDTATRIARYMFQELMGKGEKEDQPQFQRFLQKPIVGTVVTVGCAALLMLYGYEKIWPIFGASNQLLAGLALLALTAWFARTGRIKLPTAIPMVIMFAVTLTALVMLARNFFGAGNFLMGGVASVLFILAIVLILTTIKSLKKEARL